MFSIVGLMSLESFQHRKFPSFVALAVKGFTVCFVLKRTLLPQSSFYCSARKLLRLYHIRPQHKTHRLVQKVAKLRGLLSATKVA